MGKKSNGKRRRGPIDVPATLALQPDPKCSTHESAVSQQEAAGRSISPKIHYALTAHWAFPVLLALITWGAQLIGIQVNTPLGTALLVAAALWWIALWFHKKQNPRGLNVLAGSSLLGLVLYLLWNGLLSRASDLTGTLDVGMYTDAASIDVRYDPSDPTTQLWVLSEKTLYTINSALHITLSNTSEKPIAIASVSVEMNCGSSSTWTKLDRVDPPSGKLVTHAEDGSPLKASVLEYTNLTDALAARPIEPHGSGAGLLLLGYPEHFLCDSRNPRYRLRLTDTAAHKYELELHGAAGQEKYDRVGRWKKVVTYGSIIDISGFKLDRY